VLAFVEILTHDNYHQLFLISPIPIVEKYKQVLAKRLIAFFL